MMDVGTDKVIICHHACFATTAVVFKNVDFHIPFIPLFPFPCSKIRKALHLMRLLHSSQRKNDEMLDEFDSNAPNIRKIKIHSDSSFGLAGNVGCCFWSRTKTIQHDFFPFFFFFVKYETSQMHPTFHPTSEIYDIGWDVGFICAGL